MDRHRLGATGPKAFRQTAAAVRSARQVGYRFDSAVEATIVMPVGLYRTADVVEIRRGARKPVGNRRRNRFTGRHA